MFFVINFYFPSKLTYQQYRCLIARQYVDPPLVDGRDDDEITKDVTSLQTFTLYNRLKHPECQE
jgi:hypothetical protein